MRVRLESLGCRLNTSEVEDMARKLIAAGHSIVGADEPADLCVLNTCTVTHTSERKSRQMARQARRNNPKGLVVVTGCYAERGGVTLKSLGADCIIANEEKDRLLGILEESGQLKMSTGQPIDAVTSGLRIRTFLKVQDGCDRFCAYCIVPFVRPQKSCVQLMR